MHRQGTVVFSIRAFRNTDPPALVEVWNQTFTNRGAAPLLNSTPLERFVFAKPNFDPAGLFLAEQDGRCVGFLHAALGPEGVPQRQGVICLLGVRPDARRQGIGTALLESGETYLRDRGALQIFAGPHWPLNPFYLGLYGGSDSPGFLDSDAEARPFFEKHGYETVHTVHVLQRRLDQLPRMPDPRFAGLRPRLLIRGCIPRKLDGYWAECVLGFIEPVQLVVEDQRQGTVMAQALVWDMEGYATRFGGQSVGILRFEVDPVHRRQGIGKYLLSHLLKQLRDQYFQVVEVHLADSNTPARDFLNSLDFEHVDTGRVFRKRPPG